ncbi:hypothetical protein ACTJLC_26400 [Paraburkholderia sp. 22099]|uniref:hypothetical protein n=1 Tax=Paraburkholderia sp. 22099 TaxID=3453875 RepID=UPI003F8788EB
MHPVLVRSFGGLPPRHYVRQLLFSLFFPGFLLLASTHGKGLLALPVHLQVILALDTLLYPYSRYVYESVTGYIVGDTVLIFPAIFYGAIKLFTMLFCWGFAIFIVPIVLVWLYFRGGR